MTNSLLSSIWRIYSQRYPCGCLNNETHRIEIRLFGKEFSITETDNRKGLEISVSDEDEEQMQRVLETLKPNVKGTLELKNGNLLYFPLPEEKIEELYETLFKKGVLAYYFRAIKPSRAQ